jgi:CRISPR-associated endonuclease/helicase Cas3
MSGTMPNNLVSYYEKKDYKIYNWDGKFRNKEKRKNRIPYRIRLIEEPIIKSQRISENLLVNIKKILDFNSEIFLKQIIFVNQVERAKFLTLKLRKQLKDYNPEIICYHSQFTREDKIQKEKKIKKKFRMDNTTTPIILITTQISEFSLNISADVIYSEIGPIDSIFQRAGRLHRGGFRPNVENCICKKCQFLKEKSEIFNKLEYAFFGFFPENLESDYFKEKNDIEESKKKTNRSILPYDENIIQKTYKILKSSISDNNGYYTFPEVCKAVSEVYQYKLRPNVEYFELFKNNAIFGDKPSQILDFNNKERSKLIIRPQTYQQVQVIPYCKKSEDKTLKHTISISYNKWFLINKKIENKSNEQDIFVLPKEIKYDSDIGLDFSILNKM